MSTTLQRNDVGKFASVVRTPKSAPSFEGQEFVPDQYLFDEELGEWVSFYWIDIKFSPSDGGAQSLWLANNAEIENENEFGIKITRQNMNRSGGTAKSAAFAMYQRQKIAAENGYAPPVHGMCCFRHLDKKHNTLTTYWGYLSSVAQCVDCLEYCEDAYADFDSYCEEQREKHEKAGEIEAMLEDMGCYARTIMNEIYGEIGPSADDLDFIEWCEQNERQPYAGIENLKDGLSNIDISDLQSDWNVIGSAIGSHRYMGGDLHTRNVGYWNGDLVCIDFGHHCVE